jgi:polyisoprenoid-binding protein YceI
MIQYGDGKSERVYPLRMEDPGMTEVFCNRKPASNGGIPMKRMILAVGILALAAPLSFAQTSTWTSDTAHSEVDFTIRHLGISNVHGRFGKVAATVVLNEANIAQSTVTATIDVSTVETGETARDNHLKTDAFFDVAKYPVATFTSTSVQKSGNGLKVAGNFTLHGVTKPIVLDVEGPSAPATGMDHKAHTGFSASTTISRSAFGIGPSFPPPMIGDEVKLTIELDVAK